MAKRSLGLVLGCASFPAPLWAQQGWGTCLYLAQGRWVFGWAGMRGDPQVPARVVVGPLRKGMLLGLSSASKIGSE